MLIDLSKWNQRVLRLTHVRHLESTATRRKTWPIRHCEVFHDTQPVFFSFHFFFYPPCIATTHQGCVGQNVHVQFAGNTFSSCCPRERKAARNGLNTRLFTVSRYTRLCSPSCCLLLYLVLSCYTYPVRQPTLDSLIQWKPSVLRKLRGTRDLHSSAFIPSVVLVGNYSYRVITLSHVRRGPWHAGRCLD
jgi:hypothetical protein